MQHFSFGECIYFDNYQFLLAVNCNNKTAFCVQSKFEFSYEGLNEDFKTLPEVILNDNGSELTLIKFPAR